MRLQNLSTKVVQLGSWVLGLVWGLSVFVATPARADGVVASDFVFQLDNSVFQSEQFNLASLLEGSPIVTFPDLVIQDRVPIEVSGIQAQLNYKFHAASTYPVLGAQVAIASQEISADLTIAKIHVDAVTEEIVNGITVIGRVKGTCSNVKVKLRAGVAKAYGAVAVLVDQQGLPKVSVPWFHVEWPANAWDVGTLNCTGARGFDKKVKPGLENYLKDSSTFLPQFKTYIDDQVAFIQAGIRDWFLAPIEVPLGIRGTKTLIYPKRIEALKGPKFQVRGTLEHAFENAIFNDRVELEESSGLPVQTGFSLALPNGFLKAMSDMAYRSGFYNLRKMGSEMQGFRDFRDSGVAVAVVWPELGWYPKEMDFAFDFLPAGQPVVGQVSADSSGGLVGPVQGDLKVNVWSQEFSTEVKYRKFGQFLSPIHSSVRFSVMDVGGTPKLHMGFPALGMDLSYAWDPTYPVRNDSVDSVTIRDSVRDSFMKDGLSFDLGKLPLNEKLILAPSGFRQSGNWLLLDFKK